MLNREKASAAVLTQGNIIPGKRALEETKRQTLQRSRVGRLCRKGLDKHCRLCRLFCFCPTAELCCCGILTHTDTHTHTHTHRHTHTTMLMAYTHTHTRTHRHTHTHTHSQTHTHTHHNARDYVPVKLQYPKQVAGHIWRLLTPDIGQS